MNIKDFKVGQTVYVELTGNVSRGKSAEQCIEEWEITSVGRKNIKAVRKGWVGDIFETVFKPNEYYRCFVHEDGSCVNYILYKSRQEIEEKCEKDRLFREIRERFSYGSQRRISLEQLRAINGILEGGRQND